MFYKVQTKATQMICRTANQFQEKKNNC